MMSYNNAYYNDVTYYLNIIQFVNVTFQINVLQIFSDDFYHSKTERKMRNECLNSNYPFSLTSTTTLKYLLLKLYEQNYVTKTLAPSLKRKEKTMLQKIITYFFFQLYPGVKLHGMHLVLGSADRHCKASQFALPMAIFTLRCAK